MTTVGHRNGRQMTIKVGLRYYLEKRGKLWPSTYFNLCLIKCWLLLQIYSNPQDEQLNQVSFGFLGLKLCKRILCQHPMFDIGNNIIYKRKIFAGFISFPKGLFLNLSIIQLLPLSEYLCVCAHGRVFCESLGFIGFFP